jgi:hypothetical protein
MVKVEDLRPREMPTVPEVRQYLKDAQKHEKDADFLATEIFREIYEKVQSASCAHLFTTAQLERYAQQFARYIQLEQLVSKYGFMATDRKGSIVAIPLEALRQSNLKILKQLSDLTPEMRFPANYSTTHRFGTLAGVNEQTLVDIDADAPCWYEVFVSGGSDIVNPKIFDSDALLCGLDGYTLPAGEMLTLSVLPNEIGAMVTDESGAARDVSGTLDFSASFAPLLAGTHILSLAVDDGDEVRCELVLQKYRVSLGI